MELPSLLKKRAHEALEKLNLLWIGFYEIQGTEARRLAFEGPVPPCDRFQFGKGNVGWAAQHGIKKIIDDVKQDAQYSQCFIETASEAVLPIVYNGQKLGVLDAESDHKAFFSQASTMAALEDLAAQVACLFHSAKRERTVAIDGVVEELAALHPEKYHWTGVYLLSDPQTLSLETFRGEATPHMVIPVDKGICGAAVREGKTLNVADVGRDSRYLSCSIKTKSEIVMPIRLNGRVVGEIDIDSHVKNAFSPDDEKLIEEYCRRVSEILAAYSK